MGWVLDVLLCSAASPYAENFFFLPPVFPAGCASGFGSWLLLLDKPPLGDRLFGFRVGCRWGWLLVADGLSAGGAARFSRARLFIKGYKRLSAAKKCDKLLFLGHFLNFAI